VIGGVVEDATHEGEVSGSNPTNHVACDFTRKNTRLAATSQWASLGFKSFFSIFKSRFYNFCKKILEAGGITEPLVYPPIGT